MPSNKRIQFGSKWEREKRVQINWTIFVSSLQEDLFLLKLSSFFFFFVAAKRLVSLLKLSFKNFTHFNLFKFTQFSLIICWELKHVIGIYAGTNVNASGFIPMMIKTKLSRFILVRENLITGINGEIYIQIRRLDRDVNCELVITYWRSNMPPQFIIYVYINSKKIVQKKKMDIKKKCIK